MTMKLAVERKRPERSLHLPPWWTDVEAARKAALLAAKPCVLILNADSSAL
jgi:hypothetical protein